MADTRQSRELVIGRYKLARALGRLSADRIIGIAPNEQSRHLGRTDRLTFAARPIPGECGLHRRRIADYRQVQAIAASGTPFLASRVRTQAASSASSRDPAIGSRNSWW